MKQGYLIVDIGTGNSRVGVISTEGELLATVTKDSAYHTDEDFPDSIYFSTEEWIQTLHKLIKEALAQAGEVQILALSASSQRQGIVLISDTGESLVGYQNGDNRGAEYLGEVDWGTVKELTGLEPLPIYSGLKFLGTTKRQPYVAEKTRFFTSISDWIGYLFTGEIVYERSHAIQTALYDVKRRCWSDRLCMAVGVDKAKLPPIAEAGTILGRIKPELAESFGLDARTVFIVGAADTQIALVGSVAEEDEVTIISGTTTPVVKIKDSFRFFPCWNSPHAVDGQYMLEVNAASTGINLQRFRDLLLPQYSYEELIAACNPERPPECMAMYGMCPHQGDIPPFSGAFLTTNPLSHTLEPSDFFHALSLDIAMSVTLCVTRINALDPYAKDYLVGCGGGLRSHVVTQAIADLTGFRLHLYKGFDQATMMGCMYLCSRALGFPTRRRELQQVITPHDNPALQAYFEKWKHLRECIKQMNE